jgi:hypothetical protein
MWTRRAVVCVVLLVTLAGFTRDAAGNTVNQWKRWPKSERLAFLVGVLDSWEFMVLKGNVVCAAVTERVAAPSRASVDICWKLFDDHRAILECLTKRRMPYSQVLAIVEKYVEDNPARWDFSVGDSMHCSTSAKCRGR